MAISKTGLALVNGTTYYISVFSENNAGLKSSAISSNGQTVSLVTGLTNTDNSVLFSIFPNPNNGVFTVSIQNSIKSYKIQLTNLLGEIIDTLEIHDSKYEYNKHLPSGIYVVSVLDNNTVISTKKIIVN
jgi:hypothetical protein